MESNSEQLARLYIMESKIGQFCEVEVIMYMDGDIGQFYEVETILYLWRAWKLDKTSIPSDFDIW
jgi:hypothetical protein